MLHHMKPIHLSFIYVLTSLNIHLNMHSLNIKSGLTLLLCEIKKPVQYLNYFL